MTCVRTIRWMLLSLLCLAGSVRAETTGRAKYVFLLIGDGMGTAQRTLGAHYLRAGGERPEGSPGPGLAMNRLPVVGLTATHSADSLVTDSAAAGTAIATGRKTLSGVICVDPAGRERWPSLAEHARRRGMKVGILSTVSLDHATPACFYAHQPSRNDYWQIAMQLPESGFDYFAGGSLKGRRDKYRQGRADPFAAVRRAGYAIGRKREHLDDFQPGQKACFFCEELDEDAAMLYAIDRSPETPSLAELTAKGVELLDSPGGFFLMVEGGRLDWSCHENDAATTAAEVLDFDEAVAVAMDFYRNHPDETLVIVTADHETGGLGLGNTDAGYQMHPALLRRQRMSGWRFERQLVRSFRQKQTPLEDALPVILETFGFESLKRDELRELIAAYRLSLAGLPVEQRSAEQLRRWGRYDPLTTTCLRLVSRHAGAGWTTFKHTGLPIPTSAIGVGAETFGGMYDNTALFTKTLALLPGQAGNLAEQPKQTSAPRAMDQAGRRASVPAPRSPAVDPATVTVEVVSEDVPAGEILPDPIAPAQRPAGNASGAEGADRSASRRSERNDWDRDWLVVPVAAVVGLAAIGVVCLLFLKSR